MNLKHRSVSRLANAAAFVLSALVSFGSSAPAQKKSAGTSTNAGPVLTRTTTRRETRRLGYGGTVTIIGAPQGSIKIEGWPRSEVEVVADIELRADTEEDLAQLAAVNGFVLDDDLNHLRILSTGTHDKAFMRRVAENFPKKLLGLPWKIDYRIRVPLMTDLEINAGRGAISLGGVEGAINLTAAESDATMTLTGGTVIAALASGKMDVRIPVRSWRGVGADLRLATGELNVELPVGFNGNIDADVLRTGRIEDSYGGLDSREKSGLTERVVRARAGAGGAFFKFTIGDGTISIRKAVIGDQ